MVMRRRQGGGSDDEGGGFLSRWSERKRAAEAGALPEEAAQGTESAKATKTDAVAAQQAPDATAENAVPAALPDIDSLETGSDFSVFMKQGVPAALQRRALRKLWQVDPAFNEICMLDDYNLDYTDAAMVVPNLKTSYQVGRGMVLPEELEAELKAVAERAGETGSEVESAEEVAALPAPEEETPEPAASDAEQAAAPPAPRRAPRKPGTPLVGPAPTPTPASARTADSGVPRSARQRRWGDTDT